MDTIVYIIPFCFKQVVEIECSSELIDCILITNPRTLAFKKIGSVVHREWNKEKHGLSLAFNKGPCFVDKGICFDFKCTF